MYQLINPGYIGWWVAMWGWIGGQLGFTAQRWMSASLLSFLAAALVTLLIGGAGRLLARAGGGGAAGPPRRATYAVDRGSCSLARRGGTRHR
jgi:hypothetical protein